MLYIQGSRLERDEWVAVYYHNNFHLGKLVESCNETGNAKVRFLERRDGAYVFRKPAETLEIGTEQLFERRIKMELKGKSAYILVNPSLQHITKHFRDIKKVNKHEIEQIYTLVVANFFIGEEEYH